MNKRAFQILVVDDDLYIRQGLEKIIRQHLEGAAQVTTCENGLSAMRFAEATTVDIVVTDIKMPLVSGLDLIRRLREQEYPCKIVVLSGYDDYNLVREALRQGAVDYLLKPVDIGLLINTLQQLMASLRSEKARDGVTREEQIDMQILLEHFLGQAPMVNPLVQSFTRRCSVTQDSPCALLCVDIKNLLYSESLRVKGLLAARVMAHLRELPQGYATAICGEWSEAWMAMVFFHQKNCHIRSLYPLIQELERDFQKVSASRNIFPLNHLQKERRLCLQGLEIHYFDLNHIRDEESACGKNVDDLAEELVQAAAAYDCTEMIRCCTELFSLLNRKRSSIAQVQQTLSGIVYSLLAVNSSYIPVVSASKFTEYDILRHIETATSLSCLQKQMIASLNHYIEVILQTMANKDSFVIQRAKEYIRSNYSDSITLHDVAAHVFLHAGYFSTLFKARTGITFRQYLRSYRVEEAKKLLTGTGLKIYEVAAKVGYNESTHFVRAFKEIVRMSPGDYRRQAAGQQQGKEQDASLLK